MTKELSKAIINKSKTRNKYCKCQSRENNLTMKLATMVGRRRKISKLHWLKCPQTILKKRNLDHKINYSKPQFWNLSFNFRFFSIKSQSQQRLTKKITHFTIPLRSKNLTYFTTLNSLNIVKNILSQYSRNSTQFTNFLANMFLVGDRKKFAMHHFQTPKNYILEILLEGGSLFRSRKMF